MERVEALQQAQLGEWHPCSDNGKDTLTLSEAGASLETWIRVSRTHENPGRCGDSLVIPVLRR